MKRHYSIIATLGLAALCMQGCSTPAPQQVLEMELKASEPRSTEYFDFGTGDYDLKVDNKGLVMRQADGTMVPLQPVMGEIHPSRVNANDWEREILKMKEGGINTIACYLFWCHHEPESGKFCWTGNCDFRHFVELCGKNGLYVVLRIGPWCHGECYLGGIPDWVVADKRVKRLRSLDAQYMKYVDRYFHEIGEQMQGLFGCTQEQPIIGVQIENECGGNSWPYMMALKETALRHGIVPPFFTRTGWPAVKDATFGEMLPLYGDYADGFWDRALTDMPSGYPDAFTFRGSRLSNVIATEVFGNNQSREMQPGDLSYPYFTCELGGGMMTSYMRRIRIFDQDAIGLAICKVGSGSNMPGYYMYHGGTNPYNPAHSMAEMAESPFTNYNDLPYMTYDFQCPVGEMGQRNGSYYELRRLHSFLKYWGPEMQSMDAIFPESNSEDGRLDSLLRWTVRTDGMKGFVFINNYSRLKPMSAKEGLQWRLTRTDGTVLQFPSRPVTIADGVCAWLPFGMDCKGLVLDYATAMPYAISEAEGVTSYEFAAVPGVPVELCVNGKVYRMKENDVLDLKNAAGDKVRMVVKDDAASKLPRYDLQEMAGATAKAQLVRETSGLRELRIVEPQKIIAQPTNEEFEQAAVWDISLEGVTNVETGVLEVNYHGDVARLYADGQLVEDNFWNGRPMLVRVRDIAGKQVQLKVLPLGKEYPIYLQPDQRAELAAAEGEWMLSLDSLRVLE